MRVAGVISQTIVILEGSDWRYSGIQLADSSPNTMKVQNLSRGRFTVDAATLSPQQDRLAYIRKENGVLTAEVITTTNSSWVALSSDDLTNANGGIPLTPCNWSSIAWSPNGLRLAFFGCSRDLSTVVIVEGTDKLTPIVLKQTVASSPARQMFWLDNDNMLYTSFDAKTGQAWVHRVGATQTSVPLLVYQR